MIVPKNPPTKRCPSCGGIMTKEHGVVDEPLLLNHGRKARPVTFYACSMCEHCEEV